MQTLQHQGKHDSGLGLIDNLTYSYGGNQLLNITYATAATAYYAHFSLLMAPTQKQNLLLLPMAS